jgi:hypothetical protein
MKAIPFMTKLVALQQCKALWMWLEKHPEAEKYEWPRWNKLGQYSANCPCCQYVHQEGKSGCLDCPLNDFAWTFYEGCLNEGSMYRRWSRSSFENHADRIKYAHQMVLACRRAISALKV